MSEIGQILEYCCSSAGQITVSERVGVNNAFKIFSFLVAFVPVWDFSQ